MTRRALVFDTCALCRRHTTIHSPGPSVAPYCPQGGGAHPGERRERVRPGVPGAAVPRRGDGGQDLRQHPAGGGDRPGLLPAVQPDLQLPDHLHRHAVRHRPQR
ncbi:hypothetical protein EYF80_065109 [Liparis tanakae]|uniref:Uncharacterized protein n=1 Tax=Liparis tanakae TaxID=230148 RepID=A0A4Z2E7M8_9TELE|nr:hypothetical protein EYF80_065109 [Liparis tanakae]